MTNRLPPAVLIVEDEGLIRCDLVDTFEAAGFATFDVPTAERALLIIASNPGIEWLFTDIDLGGPMDGIDLARQVREGWPQVMISLCSGKTPDRDRMPPGVPFLSKPYDRAKLNQLIASCRDELASEP